jgi:adenosine deaminase
MGSATLRTQRYLAAIAGKPALLVDFLTRMPKGGDLHHHLTGAVYAESYIDYAVADGDCIESATLRIVAPPCDPAAGKPPAAHAIDDFSFRNRVIDAWSIRNFVPSADDPDVRVHFFAAFGKFDRVTNGHWGEMLAEVVARAAQQHEIYLETMLTPDGGAALELARTVAWTPDLQALQARLDTAGMPAVVTQARRRLDAAETKMRAVLGCGGANPDPGCRLTLRYQNQVLRALSPTDVFAQMLAGFELAQVDARVVAINLVQSQDEYRALHDFALHMRMLDFLHRRYPRVHISLHAGELTPGEVPPAQLYGSHIRESIEVGHAERIGHGLDIAYERDAPALLAEMARRHILVEDCLYSHEVVRGMTGRDNVLPIYLAAGVPVALATDDEGIVRSELTWYFKRAVEGYHVDYMTLKRMVRDSLDHAFLPGSSLWRWPERFSPVAACDAQPATEPARTLSCRAFLAHSERATLEWREEVEFNRFEARQ